MVRAIYIRSKYDAVLADFSYMFQAKYLKSTAVGKDRSTPVDEFVQSARAGNKLCAGSQI